MALMKLEKGAKFARHGTIHTVTNPRGSMGYVETVTDDGNIVRVHWSRLVYPNGPFEGRPQAPNTEG